MRPLPAVAYVLEALAQLAPMQPVRSLRHSTRAAQLRNARTCYDHLAGRLGAHLLTAFIAAEWITRTEGQRAVRLTDTGRHELHPRLGLDLPDA